MPLADTNSRFDQQTSSAATEQNQALESLRRESQAHKQQNADRGLIGVAVTTVTEFWHGSAASASKIDSLATDIAASVKAHDSKRTAELEKEAQTAILANQKALRAASQIDQYGSGLIKSVGLFMPGKYGYALTAATAALDTYKPGAQGAKGTAGTGERTGERTGHSFLEQAVDTGLGVTKAIGLKASFAYAASHNWGIAGSAVGLGVASRVAEVTLNRSTYENGNGQYSAALGASRIFAASTDTSALASDAISFVVARGALGKLNQSGALVESKMLSSVVAGGIFGASKGSSDEVIRQVKAGVFEPGQFATHVAAGAATNMIGAAIGAKAGEIRALNPSSSAIFKAGDSLAKPANDLLKPAAVSAKPADVLAKAADVTTQHFEPAAMNQAQRNFPGSTSREYKMVGTILPLAEMMAASKQAVAMTRVREVKAGGELGPEQTLLVQHHDGGLLTGRGTSKGTSLGSGRESDSRTGKATDLAANPASDLAANRASNLAADLAAGQRAGEAVAKINERLASKADLIATCNPSCLPDFLRGKHILSSAQETLWLTQIGDRLKFSTGLDRSASPSGMLQPVALGEKSVSSLLLDPNTRSMLRHKDTHDLGLYADVLRDFKVPAKRIIDGGADSVVIELSNNQILKVTNQTWNPTWGTRTYRDAQGVEHRFDARIIGTPKLTDGPYGPANFYIQERVTTPVSKTSMDLFAQRLDRDRRYSFWDRDESQLGYIDLGGGKKGLVLIDYDAVRPPHLVEKNLKKRWS
jgi:hypothetical protein